MDLQQLDCFVRVADFGGFTKAAVMLSLSQPTLSRKIRLLETELHKHLLIRNGRGARVTDEGSIFLEHAKGILEQAERARQELKDYNGSPTGKVTIAATGAIGTAVVTKLVGAFRERFPRAALEIISLRDATIYEWLSLGRVDIGIMCDPQPSPLLEITPIKQNELFAVSPTASTTLRPSAKIPLRQLVKHPLILPTVPHTIRMTVERAVTKIGKKLDIALQVDGGSFVLDLVHKGYGYTVLPRHAVQGRTLSGQLQINPIVNPRLMRTLTIAVSNQRRMTYLAQETVKLVQGSFESRDS